MQKTIDPQPLYPRLFRIARPAAIFAGALLSLLSIYQWVITLQQVMQNPFVILPDDNWKVAQLQSALAGLNLPSGFFAASALLLTLLFSLAFLACAWLILWRRSRDWFGLYLGLVLLLWANGMGVFFSPPPDSPWLATLTSYLSWIMWPGLFLLLYFFPSGHVTPRWARWFAALLGVLIVYGLIITILQVEPFSFIYAAPLIVICLLVGGFSQIYRYRHAGPLERQQVKWVMLALLFYILTFITMLLLINVVHIGDPSTSTPSRALIASLVILAIGNLAYIALPASMVLGMLRYRLWDVDVIIRRTLVYFALTLTLALVFLGTVTLLQRIFSAVSGQQSAVSVVVSTLLIAALFSPLRRRIQNDIDRRFFRKKYNAEQAIERFAAAARQQTDLDQLSAELLAVVSETMQPERVSLWLKPQEKKR
jgi:uncharacterized membrane protein